MIKVGNIEDVKNQTTSRTWMSLGRCKVLCNHWTQNVNSAEVKKSWASKKTVFKFQLSFIAV